jgi:hypothetical protein
MEAHRLVRHRRSHIFYKIGSQMAARFNNLPKWKRNLTNTYLGTRKSNLETQADRTLRVQECCSQNGGRDCSSLVLCLQAQGNQFQHNLSPNYLHSTRLIFIGKIVAWSVIINFGYAPNGSPCIFKLDQTQLNLKWNIRSTDMEARKKRADGKTQYYNMRKKKGN